MLATLTLLTLMITSLPAAGAAQPDLAGARRQRQAVQAELDRTAAAYDAAQTRLARTEASLENNRNALQQAEAASRVAQTRLAKRAGVIYRQGPVAIFEFLVGANTFSDFGRRLTLIEEATTQDAVTIETATRSREQIIRLRKELEAKGNQQKQISAAMSAQAKSLTASFARAQALEARLASAQAAAQRAEADRQSRAAADAGAAARARELAATSPAPAGASPPAPGGGTALSPGTAVTGKKPDAEAGAGGATALRCPIAGPTSFTDTWGAPRSEGRSHQGVDMFAARGTPVAAIVDGTLRLASSASGGITLYIKGTDGTEYYYAHLEGYAAVSTGQKVFAGDRIAFVGNSGNAAGGPTHVHFEVHPGGGSAINPTPTARKACGK